MILQILNNSLLYLSFFKCLYNQINLDPQSISCVYQNVYALIFYKGCMDSLFSSTTSENHLAVSQ